ncbi:MAG: tetraacyldisaccharide 4'-kinase [Chlamydiota bacterium]
MKIYDSLERKYLKVIHGKSHGPAAWFLKLSLHPLSWIYRAIIFVRNKAYDCGLLKSYNPKIPAVVSVGNIVAGGTGKTPVTMLLAKDLLDRIPLAILSRGYRSHAENLKTPLRLCNGNGPEFPVNLCGDEPYLLAENLPKARIFVGRDRKQAADMAAKQGAKLVILDDGMQHRQVSRDFDIVVLNANSPFDQGYLLPRGLLREEVSSLKRASLVILNHIEDAEQYASITERLKKYTSAPAIGTMVKITSMQTLEGQEIKSLGDKKIGMFCGIGTPESFEHTLQKSGAKILDKLILPDHNRATKQSLIDFSNHCQSLGAEYIVCTEKDKVKLIENKPCLPIPIVWTKIELEVKEGLQYWKDFIKKTVIRAKSEKVTSERSR